MARLNAPAARVLDCFQTALLRIEQGLATWRDKRDCARSDIGYLEHLMDEVQYGRMDLSLPPNLPIPQRPWSNIKPMKSRFIYPYKAPESHMAVSPMENMTSDPLHPMEMVTESTAEPAPPGQVWDTSPPPGDAEEEDYDPSPVSSTGLDWEVSQNGSDHESSVDFVMGEDFEQAALSTSESD